MFIHTSTPEETKFAASFRDMVRSKGVEVYVVPPSVEYFYVTLEELDTGFCGIVVQAMDSQDEQLDIVSGFNSCTEAYEFAKELSYAAGLGDEGYFGDTWDEPMNEPMAVK